MIPTYTGRFLMIVLLALLPMTARSQVTTPNPATRYYLFHFGGNVLGSASDDRATLQVPLGDQTQLLQFVSDGAGYYWIKQADHPRSRITGFGPSGRPPGAGSQDHHHRYRPGRCGSVITLQASAELATHCLYYLSGGANGKLD